MPQQLIDKLSALVVSLSLLLSSMFGQIEALQQQITGGTGGVGSDTIGFVGGQTYRLSGSGITSSATSIGLTSFQQPVSGIELTMSDFGSIGFATVEPGTSKKEFISFTGVTQSGSDDTATLTGVTRGLSFVSPYTASSTLQQSHSGGAKLIISNPPQLYDRLATKNNDESIRGTWTFASSSPPAFDENPNFTSAASTTIISKGYADNLTIAGAPNGSENTRGIFELASGIEAASSTQTGPTTARLIPGANLIDTNCSVATSSLVMTKTDGKISKNCMSTSTSYEFGGVTTRGTNTVGVGTTSPSSAHSLSVEGDVLITGTLNATSTELNKITYTWPSSQGSSGTQLTNNGAGALTWSGSPERTLYHCFLNEDVDATSYMGTTTPATGFGAPIANAASTMSCFINFVLPTGKSITRFHTWAGQDNATAQAGNIVLRWDFFPLSDGVLFGTADDNSADTTFTDLDSTLQTQLLTVASTSFDSITAGKPYQLRILRKPQAAADTLGGGIRILGLDVKLE